jgi:hypothetical protein
MRGSWLLCHLVAGHVLPQDEVVHVLPQDEVVLAVGPNGELTPEMVVDAALAPDDQEPAVGLAELGSTPLLGGDGDFQWQQESAEAAQRVEDTETLSLYSSQHLAGGSGCPCLATWSLHYDGIVTKCDDGSGCCVVEGENGDYDSGQPYCKINEGMLSHCIKASPAAGYSTYQPCHKHAVTKGDNSLLHAWFKAQHQFDMAPQVCSCMLKWSVEVGGKTYKCDGLTGAHGGCCTYPNPYDTTVKTWCPVDVAQKSNDCVAPKTFSVPAGFDQATATSGVVAMHAGGP